MKKLIAQFMKFGIVGVIAFLIDYGLMVALTEFFGVPYLISNTISFTVSVVFNYVASMRFVVLSIIGLILNDLFMWLFVSVWFIDYRIAKIIVTVLVAIWNFVTRKIFLEKH